MTKLIEIGGKIFAIVGVIASLVAVFQFSKDQLYGKRSINALYRYYPVTSSASPFVLGDYAKDELKNSFQIVRVNVVVWNSGQEPLGHSELRNPIVLEFEEGSSVIGYKIDRQRSAEKNNFSILPSNENQSRRPAFVLGWRLLDPGEYVELVFLIGTSKRLSESTLIRISGAFSGGVFVEGQDYESRKRNQQWMVGPGFLLSVAITFVLFLYLHRQIQALLVARSLSGRRWLSRLAKATVTAIVWVAAISFFVGLTYLMFKVALPNPLWL